MNALASHLRTAILNALSNLQLRPDVGKLEQVLLNAAVPGGGVAAMLNAVSAALGEILPGAPALEIGFARTLIGFALNALHTHQAAIAGELTEAGGEDDGDGDEDEGPDDPQFMGDEPACA